MRNIELYTLVHFKDWSEVIVGLSYKDTEQQKRRLELWVDTWSCTTGVDARDKARLWVISSNWSSCFNKQQERLWRNWI